MSEYLIAKKHISGDFYLNGTDEKHDALFSRIAITEV